MIDKVLNHLHVIAAWLLEVFPKYYNVGFNKEKNTPIGHLYTFSEIVFCIQSVIQEQGLFHWSCEMHIFICHNFH